MKFTTDPQPYTFVPMQVTISIESAEELRAVHNLCQYNVTVPELVAKTQPGLKGLTVVFLDGLREELVKRIFPK